MERVGDTAVPSGGAATSYPAGTHGARRGRPRIGGPYRRHDFAAVQSLRVGTSALLTSSELHRGRQRLRLWRGKQADPHRPSMTPNVPDETSEVARLETLYKRQQRGLLPTNDWLDTLAHRTMDRLYTAQMQHGKDLVLTIDMPSWDVPLVFGEPEPVTASLSVNATRPASDAHVQRPWIHPSLFTINDLDDCSENVVEAKHRRLVRSQRVDALDRERKPTAAVRDELHVCPPLSPRRAYCCIHRHAC